MKKQYILLIFILLLNLVLIRNTSAIETSFNNINFKPAVDNSDYFTVYSSRNLKQKEWDTGLYLDFAYNPIQFSLSGGRKQDLLKQLFVADIYGAIGIFDFWEMGMNIPVVIYDKYRDPVTRETSYRHSLSDIRLMSKFMLLDPARYHVGISLMPYIDIPTRLGDTYVSNGSVSGGGDVIVDVEASDFFSISANLGYLVRDHYTDQYGADIDDQFTYGIGIAAKPVSNWSIIMEIVGATDASSQFGKKLNSPLEIRGGFTVEVIKNLILSLGGGSGVRGGFGDPLFRFFGGVKYDYGRSEKQSVSSSKVATQAALPIQDTKSNLFLPVAAAPVGQIKEEPELSYDEKELAALSKINPEISQKEVSPIVPSKIAESSSVTTTHALPLWPPIAAEEPIVSQKDSEPKKSSTAKEIAEILSVRIYYPFGGYKVNPKYYPELDQISVMLKKHPKIDLSVDGHTCNIGTKIANFYHSILRAIYVENYLVSQGVPSYRLTHKGYGETHPIGDNSTADGRSQNRRAEFSIIIE